MRRSRRTRRFEAEEDVNPMNYISNLSDVMLIFAVGIMLALITHWRLDVTPQGVRNGQGVSGSYAGEQVDADRMRSFSEEERERMRAGATEGGAEDGMEKTGEVFYDPATKTYYIVEIEP